MDKSTTCIISGIQMILPYSHYESTTPVLIESLTWLNQCPTSGSFKVKINRQVWYFFIRKSQRTNNDPQPEYASLN